LCFSRTSSYKCTAAFASCIPSFRASAGI
jgi:hypothetical protein